MIVETDNQSWFAKKFYARNHACENVDGLHRHKLTACIQILTSVGIVHHIGLIQIVISQELANTSHRDLGLLDRNILVLCDASVHKRQNIGMKIYIDTVTQPQLPLYCLIVNLNQ